MLNRYRDVYPYDHSRVILNGHGDTDYINASLVEVRKTMDFGADAFRIHFSLRSVPLVMQDHAKAVGGCA